MVMQLGFKRIYLGTSVPLLGCRLQHNIAPTRSQTIFANGKRNEGSDGWTAAGEQPHIGGNEINAARRRVGNQKTRARCDRDFRGRAVNLTVQEQRDGALVAGRGGILMQPGMEGGHRRHGLDQQEDTEAESSNTALRGAHQPSGRGWHHGRQYETAAASMSTAFFVIRQ
jgi:hypothetical protein